MTSIEMMDPRGLQRIRLYQRKRLSFAVQGHFPRSLT